MKNSILKNRLYLYLTEFFAGMSVMAVEPWGKQTAGTLFQLFPDRMDDHYRNDHDRNGAWQPVWRKGSR